jgi:photosystem II stability/assembly factor-like uncharacterized protein
VQVTEAAPLVDTTSETLGGTIQQGAPKDLPLNGRSFQTLDQSGPLQKYSAVLMLKSGAFLWGLGKGGIIDLSTDGGKTWVSQVSPAHEDWLEGDAVSDMVCWLVGVHGVIARTTDGTHWEKIAPPAAAADANGVFPDWTHVKATDKNSAVIVAWDGRKFSTSNGGKTWRLQ